MKHLTLKPTALLLATTFAGLFIASTVAANPAEDAAQQLRVVDALYRFAQGMDQDDAKLLQSAFAEDAVADFTPAAKRVGVQFPVLRGRDTIVAVLGGFANGLVTSHSVSNPRVEIQGQSATLQALVEAQHLPNNDPARFALMKNSYRVSLNRVGDQWLIRSMTIENLWSQGDMKVLTGQ
jgi:hypothetical protein